MKIKIEIEREKAIWLTDLLEREMDAEAFYQQGQSEPDASHLESLFEAYRPILKAAYPFPSTIYQTLTEKFAKAINELKEKSK